MDKNNDILNSQQDERIESFLRGQMSEAQEKQFKEDIKNDAELRNRALSLSSLVKGIHTKEQEKEQNIINSVGTTRRIQTRRLMLWACSVAAVFLILFGVHKEYQYRSMNSMLSPYYTEYDMWEISRGEVDSVKVAHLYALFNQVKEKRNVSSVVKELEQIYASIYSDFSYNTYANDIAWNLALAYVKDNQKEKAIALLEKLKADNPDTPVYNRANELLINITEK